MYQIELNNKNFWIAQAIGWAIFALSNVAIQVFTGFPAEMIFNNTIYATLGGIAVTTFYREIIRRFSWRKVKPLHLIAFIMVISFALALCWIFVVAIAFAIFVKKGGLSPGDIVGNIINGSLIFLIWNLIYFFFQYFSKFQQAEIERWQLTAEVRDAQLGTLKSQIRPHFMFNTLNNIQVLILEDKEKAQKMLLNFSELLRYALKMSKQSFISIEEEVKIIRKYLQLLSIQYENRLSYHIKVDPDLLDEQIPPMMLQLLVENGIKHGIDQQPKGGELIIDIFKNNGFVYIEVSNTGSLSKGASLESRIGIGLENIKDRLKLLYKGKARLQLVEQAPLVVATIIIPCVT